MRRVAVSAASVLATLALVAMLWLFRDVVILFVVSLLIAATVRPPVRLLVQRGIPLALALLVCYVSGLAVVAIVLIAVGGLALAELDLLADRIVLSYEYIMAQWPGGTALQAAIAARLPAPNDLYGSLGGQGLTLVQTVMGVTSGVADLATKASIALVLSVYWGIDHVRFERLWLSLLPSERRARARSIWRSIETGIGSYLRSELVQGLIAVIFLTLGYRAIGIEYAALLALIGAIAWLIPLVGGALAIVPVLLLGLVGDPVRAIAAAVFALVIFGLLELVVEPRFFLRRRYSPILVMLMILVMADAFGLIGLLLAPPLAAAVQIFLGALVTTPKPVLEAMPQLQQLEDRLASLRAHIAAMEEAPGPEMLNMVERLDELIQEARADVQTAAPASMPARQAALAVAGKNGEHIGLP